MKDPALAQEVFELVVENFPNGFRADFITENQIRYLFKEKYDDAEISLDCKIFDLVAPKAIESDGRLYVFPEQAKRRIRRLVEKIFDNNELIFYESLFERHREFVTSLNIWSVEILKKLIRNSRKKYFCGEEYFSKSECTNPAQLIENLLRCNELAPEEIETLLPYIPLRAICEILTNDAQFLPTKAGYYTLTDNVCFDEREILSKRSELYLHIKQDGHALLEPELLPNNIELNPNIVVKDLLLAIYTKFWSEDFSRNGRILTTKGESLGTTALLQDFCATRDFVTAEELFGYAKMLAPDCYLQTALYASRKNMIRVSEDLFVNRKLINFSYEDIAAIDETLENFVHDKVISLNSIASFTMFPPVENYVWNGYLLESFVRNFSLRYKFMAPSENNSCVGAIYPKWMKFKNYFELQAGALIKGKVALNSDSVVEFLQSSGLRSKIRKDSIDDLIRFAKKKLSKYNPFSMNKNTMNKYTFDEDTGGIELLEEEDTFSREPRPVYAPEMNTLGFDEHWKYDSQTEIPYLWSAAATYFYRGQKIAHLKGGSLYEEPALELEDGAPTGFEILPIDIGKMVEKNREIMLATQQFAVKRIYNYWQRWNSKLDCFHVAFSGGKDSVVLLDLVKRALPKSAFIVVFGDTGMEFPDTYRLVEQVEAQCEKEGIRFYRARSHLEPGEAWNIFGPPSNTLRWCCSVLKAAPQTLKIRELLGRESFVGADFVGVRRHESFSRSEYEVENFGRKQRGQHSHNSILEWNSAEIWNYIFTHGLPVNEAYKKGNSRVGCLFCPMSGSRANFFRRNAYPAEVEKFVDCIRNSVNDENIESYISNGGWINRRSGRDLISVPKNYSERRDENFLYITVDNPATDWREWIKTLGELPFRYEVTATETGYVVKVPARHDRTTAMKFFKSVFHKAAVCVGCGVCAANCRTGAISFADSLKIKNCVHCLSCHDIPMGCLFYNSTRLPLNGGAQMIKPKNTFKCHAPKPEWVRDFFERLEGFMAQNGLGNPQQETFRRFLFDAELVNRKDKRVTDFALKLKEIGWDSDAAWGLILVNLAHNNPQIRWYIQNLPVEETFARKTVEENLKALSVSDRDANEITRAFKRLCETPLGTALNFGKTTSHGKILDTMTRTKAHISDGRVILYALYKFAKSGDGTRQFNLTRLMNFSDNELSPAQIFGLNRTEMERILNGLSVNYPRFINVSFTHDLEKISLSEEMSAKNVWESW